MDYNTLVGAKTVAGSIASWANYGLAPVTVILDEAQALIYQHLRVTEMRSDLTSVPIASGAVKWTTPADWLEPIAVFNQYRAPLRKYDPTDLALRRGKDGDGVTVTGQPSSYALFGGAVQFDCAADSDLTYECLYYRSLPLLASGNQTNFLTARYPSLLRTACLAMAADFRKDDDDYARNVQRLEALIASVAVKDDLSNAGIEVDADYSRI